jgi:hypothetical protein
MTETNYLTQTQLADRWQIAESTLERWRSKGIGPDLHEDDGPRL